MQRSTVAWLVAAGAIAVAAPALAAQGGNGNGNSQPRNGTTSNIELASVNGTPAGAAAAAVTPKYGDTVRFSTTVEKLAGWEYPLVALQCYQDVNKDGKIETNMFGPDIVFAAPLSGPDGAFSLGGGTSTSTWASRGGGAAVCRADLDAYGWSNKAQSIRVLDSTEFNVSG
jgi:hypothetical protein